MYLHGMNPTYEQFLEGKRKLHTASGFEADLVESSMFPFQRHVTTQSLKYGKYAIFSGTGTGKTRMQVYWADAVTIHTNRPVLIMAPLAVAGQTIQEAKALGIIVQRYAEAVANGDLHNCTQGVYIINYDQLDNVNLSIFSGIALDEASILKNHEGAYRNELITRCKHIAYKSVWTATPSPNDPMEIGNYSEFLDVMSRSEMLAMYFVHDGGETSKWRLKGHARKQFWQWVSSWAIMFQHPRDIGFDQVGYDLPDLIVNECRISTDKRDNGMLFNDMAVSATNFNRELRLTQIQRVDKVVEIVKSLNGEPVIIWIKHNEEGAVLRKMLPESVEVTGSDSREVKEQRLLGFARGEFKILITKSKIAGMGLNYQHCGNQIFASPDFSFEMVFQALRRSLRFGRAEPVYAWIVTTDTMTNVIETFKRKQRQHDEMQSEMTAAVNIFSNKIHYTRMFKEHKTENFTIQLGDSVQLIKQIKDESIGFSIWSPPFSELYVYSDQIEDMGNSKDYTEFLTAFNFLVQDLYRVMQSGRNVAVHCMDLPIQKGKEGYIGLRDFSGMIRQSFEDAGFIYHSRVTIWKNPVTEMQRTKALGLLHKQIKKDAAMSRVGIPDYLLVFRKPGEHNNPVTHQDTDPSAPGYLPVDLWQQYASPVWMDIDQGNTLNARDGRDTDDGKHICPLQLDTIQRSVRLWSNKGDMVLTCFAGIGSEIYQSILEGRKAIGFELKESYYETAIKNCTAAEQSLKQTDLFSQL